MPRRKRGFDMQRHGSQTHSISSSPDSGPNVITSIISDLLCEERSSKSKQWFKIDLDAAKTNHNRVNFVRIIH